ncbi:MAG: methyltransferase domain-containing protein [Pseudomonadota bacterium]
MHVSTHPGSTPHNLIPVASRFFGSWHVSIGRRAYAPAELEAHYDRESGVWQTKIDTLGFEDAYQSLIRTALQQEDCDVGTQSLRVLDAGIGTGAMSAAFSKLFRRKFQLVGIDVSSRMLDQARRRLSRTQAQLQLHKADLGAIPYPDNSFDVVLVAHVLEHMPNPAAAMSELLRVLKPGGLLIACITRRSLVGAYIQLKWRTHGIDIQSALCGLRQSGFQSVRAIPLDRRSATRLFSIGYVGRKPERLVSREKLPTLSGQKRPW